MTYIQDSLLFIVFATSFWDPALVTAQSSQRLNQLHSALPDMLSAALSAEPYRTRYELSDSVNPYFLEGNYDSDGHPDYVVMLTDQQTSSQKGLLFLSSRKEPIVIYDSAQIDHHPLDAWVNCHWVNCGRTILRMKSARQSRPVASADVILLRFGGPDVILFWDGKRMRRLAVKGE
jgi:hypothetical protein